MRSTGGTPATAAVLAAEPAIRRVIRARVSNAADIDDLVQDCLERLLKASERLAPEAVLPYGIVTARNLAASHARTEARRAAAVPRLAEQRETERPEQVVLADETRQAMALALARLPAQERTDLLSYYDDDLSGPAGASAAGASAAGASAAEASTAGATPPGAPGAVRIRMARTRAKLRLEYLLAFRQIELPTEQCRKVLIAISGNDARRQRELGAGRHLLTCEVCSALCEPLERRSIALTAITLPVGLAAWLLSKAKAHPVQAAASAAGAAAVATAAVLTASPHPARPHPVPSPAPAPLLIPGLRAGGQAVDLRHPVTVLAGEPAIGRQVAVQSVVSRNGFWVGTSRARLWVELTGPLRAIHITARDRVSFTGMVVGNGGSAYPRRAGVTDPPDVALLERQAAHIKVRTTDIRVTGPA